MDNLVDASISPGASACAAKGTNSGNRMNRKTDDSNHSKAAEDSKGFVVWAVLHMIGSSLFMCILFRKTFTNYPAMYQFLCFLEVALLVGLAVHALSQCVNHALTGCRDTWLLLRRQMAGICSALALFSLALLIIYMFMLAPPPLEITDVSPQPAEFLIYFALYCAILFFLLAERVRSPRWYILFVLSWNVVMLAIAYFYMYW